MKIRIPQPVLVEIGPLDATFKLPMARRLFHQFKTTCDYCGGEITDEFFVAAVQRGRPNMKFHESCIPESERKDVSRL